MRYIYPIRFTFSEKNKQYHCDIIDFPFIKASGPDIFECYNDALRKLNRYIILMEDNQKSANLPDSLIKNQLTLVGTNIRVIFIDTEAYRKMFNNELYPEDDCYLFNVR